MESSVGHPQSITVICFQQGSANGRGRDILCNFMCEELEIPSKSSIRLVVCSQTTALVFCRAAVEEVLSFSLYVPCDSMNVLPLSPSGEFLFHWKFF